MVDTTALLTKTLADDGIVSFSDVYSRDDLQVIKSAIDPLLASRSNEKRAYVHPDELSNLGLMPVIFSSRMKSILFSIMPDPVLYHFHVYEIAANNPSSHIFGDQLQGWHRDEDSEYFSGEPTHVSLFTYLTDVGADDGAFEFVPSRPTEWLKAGTPYISAQGSAGFTFAWNRPFFHRASPNRGPVRRRLLKISIQRNRFPSAHLNNAHFQAMIKGIPAGDPEMDLLLGRYQGGQPPHVRAYPLPSFSKFVPTNKMTIANTQLFYIQLRKSLKNMKNRLMQLLKLQDPSANAAYD